MQPITNQAGDVRLFFCDAVECDDAVFETRQNHRYDKRHKRQQNGFGDGATDAAYVTQRCETAGYSP